MGANCSTLGAGGWEALTHFPGCLSGFGGSSTDWTGQLGFTYTFNCGEPNGVYVVGFRLTDPASDETIALTTRTFTK